MKGSVEKKILEGLETDRFKESRLDTPIIKYFWQASPLAGKKPSIHKFLRRTNVFENFSDYEVYTLTKFIHLRNYQAGETVFKEGDGGFAFYMLFKGSCDVYTTIVDPSGDEQRTHITELSRYEHFGEMALLEKQNRRSATLIAKENTVLLAIFRPDLEDLIDKYPVVGAKLLQSLGVIVANRLNSVATELKLYKEKYFALEQKVKSSEE